MADLKNFDAFDHQLLTERLKLRKLKKQDANDIFEYTSVREISKYLSWSAHESIEETYKFIDQTIAEYNVNKTRYTWGIELVGEKKIVGVVSIFNISYVSKRVEVSYILNSNYQGQGYMSEALSGVVNFIFNEVGFIRFEARCSEDNKSSEKVMKSLGMNYEGKLLKFWNIKGTFKNVLIYARLNE